MKLSFLEAFHGMKMSSLKNLPSSHSKPFEANRLTSVNSSAAKTTMWYNRERKNYTKPGMYFMETFEIPLSLHWRHLEIQVKKATIVSTFTTFIKHFWFIIAISLQGGSSPWYLTIASRTIKRFYTYPCYSTSLTWMPTIFRTLLGNWKKLTIKDRVPLLDEFAIYLEGST